MKQTVYESDFHDAFRRMNRSDNFDFFGRRAIYEYLTEMEESMDEEIELDVIAICCEWSQYEDFDALQQDYDSIESLEDLEANTTVLRLPGGVLVIQQF